MDPQLRDTARQTAEDFEWLEAYCRTRPELVRRAGELRLAAGLTRNVIAPTLDGIRPPPLYIAVVGGAGTGKSTVTNILLGQIAAEVNPQAGYTRHPTAFLDSQEAWPMHLGFIGPLRRLANDAPSSLDEDVYQVRKLSLSESPLSNFIVWDCPDMTTWASTNYASRLLEIAALADVIVYVASDERYNDEVPTQFLQLLIRAGKAIVVVLTKMDAANAAVMIDHFRREVLDKIAPPPANHAVPVVAIPHMSPTEQNTPATAPSRTTLLNQLLVLCPNPADSRNRTASNAVAFLEASADSLLEVARRDLAELEAWKNVVATGSGNFAMRYRNEFLAGEPFQRFERSRSEILNLLELPGQSRPVSNVLQTIRFPCQWLLEKLGQFIRRPDTPNLPERSVLASAMSAWLDSLQAESLRRAGQSDLWKRLSTSFDDSIKNAAQKKFEDCIQQFEREEAGELEQSARSLSESFARKSLQLHLARYGTIALQILAVVALSWYALTQGFSFWNLIWLVPLAAFVGYGLVDIGVRFIVERHRRQARAQREALLTKTVLQPMSSWLETQPISGGSPMERLQSILARVPSAIRAMAAALPRL